MADGGPRTRVLMVEDDRNIVDLVRANLLVRGFDTRRLRRRATTRCELLETEQPDLVLLDLMLPGADGFELCRQIRERSSVGIIVVSARGGEQDKVPRPQPGRRRLPDQAVRHRRAAGPDHAPRCAAAGRAAAPRTPRRVLTFGNVKIDLDAPAGDEATAQPVHLTPTEFALLRELALAPGQAAERTPVLLRPVWGPGYETETEYTRVYVRRLRAKLEDAGRARR